ncbi:MAG: 2-C-methyl-D-erythritol 4-phosphate cytidylyltransferase [Bacillota bacterium]
MPTVRAIVVAAGRGERFGVGRDKLLVPLGGIPVILRSLMAVAACPRIEGIVLVVRKDQLELYRSLVETYRLSKVTQIVAGGARRQDSVRAGLAALGAADFVVIHDGARPLVPSSDISAVIDVAVRTGAATLGREITDTVKAVVGGRIAATLDRSRLRTVQTPQVFRRDWLQLAYDSAGPSVTDDAALVEAVGHEVAVVEGSRRNLKITREEDLEEAELLLAGDLPSRFRVGIGYDSHRLAGGRPLVLGGVTISHQVGLMGHSDADVLTHALIDALLGAAAAGDIGQRFPDSDPRYAGISSLELLRRTVELLRIRGLRAQQVDATIIAEQPKLAPFIDQMRGNLAAILGIPLDRVSVKAKTNEGMGFIGRGEGMVAQVVVTIG